MVLGLYKTPGKFANNKLRRASEGEKVCFDLWISSNSCTGFLCIYGRSAGNFACHCTEVLGISEKVAPNFLFLVRVRL